MKKNIANFISLSRILGSIILAFTPLFSSLFYIIYLMCGLTDMLDGIVARRTKTTSTFGEKLDTCADFLFVIVSLIKMLSQISISKWLWAWIVVIAIIKASNIIVGFIKTKNLVSIHSKLNKVTGLLLFILPLTFGLLKLEYSATVVSLIATVSAVQELYFIQKVSNQNEQEYL